MKSSAAASLLIAVALLLAGCNSPRPITRASAPSPAEAPKPATNWLVTINKNELTGAREIIAENAASRRVSLVVRRRGKRLECYISTDQFLETLHNMYAHESEVLYRFDDGHMVLGAWDISKDRSSAFYPGDPQPFLDKINHSRRLVVQFEPAYTIPQTATFDVANFPADIFR